MKKKIANRYFSPTPKPWRIAGDLALLLIPAAHIAVENAPDLSETTRYWITIAADVALLAVKYFTNTKTHKDGL